MNAFCVHILSISLTEKRPKRIHLSKKNKNNIDKKTYKLKKIPVKDVVVDISLTVKQVAEKLA